MLQRQIIFKQLQKLQRKQQLQELGDARNQHYINQPSSLKQALEGQFPSAVNGMPVHNSSQMLMVGKVQMMQDMHDESEIVPSHNHSMIQVGLPYPQLDVSLYGVSTPNTNKNLDLYSHLQGPPDHSANLSTKNNNGALEMPNIQPLGFHNSLLNKQSSLYSDRLSMPDESLLPNQVPVQGFSSGISCGNYSHQGMTTKRCVLPLESEARQENEGWHEFEPGKVLKPAPSDPDASLDPLEQKFLYSTNDNIWDSSFSRSLNIGLGTFESAMEHTTYIDRVPTTQSGSWSALMQSAVAEISSDGGGLQEASSDLYGQSMISQTSNMLGLMNKDSRSTKHSPGMHLSVKVSACNESQRTETSVTSCAEPCNNSPTLLDPWTTKSHLSIPSLVMGNSCSTYPSGHTVNNHFENQHCPVLPKPADMAPNDLVYSYDNSMLKNSNFMSSELPILKNEQVNQAAVTSVSSQHVGLQTASQWVDMTTQPCALSTKSKKSPNFFCSLNSESSSLETSLVLPNEQSSINSFTQECDVQGFFASSGKPEFHEQQLAESFLQNSSSEIINSISVSSYNHGQDSYRENHLEAKTVATSSLMTQSHQPSNNLEQIDTAPPSCTARDLKSLALSQTKPMLHQVSSSRDAAVTNAKDAFWHGQKEGVNSEAKGSLDVVSHIDAFPSLNSKGWDLQEVWRALSDKGFPPNIQNMQMLGQNDCSSYSNDACNTTYQSQVSLQLAQYISKHGGTLENGRLFPTYDPKAAGNTVKQLSGMIIERTMLPSITATLIASELSSPDNLTSYVTCQDMAVSVPKKRKIAFDMVPWHKEVKRNSFTLQNIRVAELEWAEASNRRHEEVKNEAEILEDVHPRFRAKRRLVFATQLMQQVFQPAPAVILSSDAGSNCVGVTYFAARFSFADACLASSNSQMVSDGNGMSLDKLKSYKRCSTPDFSEVVEGLVDKVKRLEGELSRMDKTLSIVDIKVESQELEKFSIINRFAKFHIKARPTGADPTASNVTSTVSKTYPQRYVLAHPMPKTVPEGIGCHSL